ncbi:TIGR03086 family metal-binding protein [Williamsia sp. CHRR-6]|uniref:TIGR03086 family metal-binding protein n=1 Tax=Williamsia sp. CHRR-6 TaxID=2835871 RepID=UPI001BDB5A0F|nr:TIGR03086 family metal-binding protein [Williamsia sp. CHRR-6]MBT0566914.1 TIGR03086 family protein [Williamsia sp. CHRR-6]
MNDSHDPSTRTDLVAVIRQLADILDAVDPADAHVSTPCTEFDLTALRSHVVGWLTAFADGLTDPGGSCSDPDAVTVAGSGAAQARSVADRLDAIDDAALAEQVLIGEQGLPTAMALSMMLWEYQMHGWDLAAAIGHPWSPDERGIEASLLFAPMMLGDGAGGADAMFGPPVAVADDARPLDRLLGLSGRDPAWSAASRSA